jgi:hypothetical protein
VYAQAEQRGAAQSTGFGPGGMQWIQELTASASSMCHDWKPGARIAVLNNPFRKDWQADFTLNLTCREKDLRVEPIDYDGPSVTT